MWALHALLYRDYKPMKSHSSADLEPKASGPVGISIPRTLVVPALCAAYASVGSAQ